MTGSSARPDHGGDTLGRPAARYGDDRGGASVAASRFVAVLLGVLVTALLVAGGYLLYTTSTTDSVSIDPTGYEVQDDNTVLMQVDVTRDDPQTPVYCIVRAREASGAETGRREFYVPASEHGTVRTEVPISTLNRAVDVDPYGCGTDIPSYLQRY